VLEKRKQAVLNIFVDGTQLAQPFRIGALKITTRFWENKNTWITWKK
jgi:sulfoacetaldehyde acetyltransferase